MARKGTKKPSKRKVGKLPPGVKITRLPPGRAEGAELPGEFVHTQGHIHGRQHYDPIAIGMYAGLRNPGSKVRRWVGAGFAGKDDEEIRKLGTWQYHWALTEDKGWRLVIEDSHGRTYWPVQTSNGDIIGFEHHEPKRGEIPKKVLQQAKTIFKKGWKEYSKMHNPKKRKSKKRALAEIFRSNPRKRVTKTEARDLENLADIYQDIHTTQHGETKMFSGVYKTIAKRGWIKMTPVKDMSGLYYVQMTTKGENALRAAVRAAAEVNPMSGVPGGGISECIEEMSTRPDVDDPGALCAWIAQQRGEFGWRSLPHIKRGRKKTTAERKKMRSILGKALR